MSQGLSTDTSTVILLEAEPSLRRLITLGLDHQGLKVVAASSLGDVSTDEIAAADLLVLDIDGDFACDWPLLEAIQQHPQLAMLPSVVLSWEMLQPVAASSVDISRCTFLPKPFDARAMQRQIRELLTLRITEKNAALARAEAILLASSRRPRASIWPLVTALGLFLIVSGILWQLVITILGLIIVAAGLLLWTLGTQVTDTHEVAPA
jgi:Response regulators consisting of a CheY-like receiver domain and a winged-helix DNA-binding domain